MTRQGHGVGRVALRSKMAQEELVPTPGTRVSAMDEKQRSVAGSTFGQPAQHLKIAKTGAIHAGCPTDRRSGVQQGGQGHELF
jgi:hypothetical protein